jgi:zinc/manganese transport system substrate-binding protein
MVRFGKQKITFNIIQRFYAVGVALAVLLGLFPTATLAENTGDSRPLKIVASFSILADMTQAIAGDAAEVTALVGPDADAHVFEPSPANARQIANADLIILNGLHFEGWIDRLIVASAYRGPVVVATKGITPRLLDGAPDPHAWQSLSNAKWYIENIRQGLVLAAPENSATINLRAAAYQLRIDTLEKEVRAQIDLIPPDARRVITSHDAFGYFGASYGVEFLSPQGWSTDSEASAADVAHIIRQIRALHVHALFIENITDPRLIERIATEARVAVGGTLYSDALSPPGTAADTYLKLFSHNTSTLTTAMRKPAQQLKE